MQIRAENVSFGYPHLPVLREVSFDVAPGEFLSILGPNGSGKSTLLRLLSRILVPDSGLVTIGGKPLDDFGRKELARIIGYVPQETHWLFPFTVMEVVLMGRTPYVGTYGFEGNDDLERCRRAMKQTDVLHLADKPITAISGGERQRVLIARALAQEPRILLLDEPNAHLDLLHQMEIFHILKHQHRDEGLTILSVSHDLNLAAAFSTKVLLLSEVSVHSGNGVAAIGSPVQVLTPESIEQVFHTRVRVDRIPETDNVRILFDPASLPTQGMHA